VCIGRKKLFDTAVGSYSYQQLKPAYYSLAYSRQETNEASYLMASAEKALCDKLYLAPALSDCQAVEQYLFDSLRIAPEALGEFDLELITRLAETSGKRNIKLLKELLR
jgi:hypothetical protein